MSTPNVSPWGTWGMVRFSREHSPKLSPRGWRSVRPSAENWGEGQDWEGQHSVCSLWFYLVCATSPNPSILYAETKPPVLPIGIEASTQWGAVEEGIWGSRVLGFFSSIHPSLLILVLLPSPLSLAPQVTSTLCSWTFWAPAGWFLTFLTPRLGFSFLWSARSLTTCPSVFRLPESYYYNLFTCSPCAWSGHFPSFTEISGETSVRYGVFSSSLFLILGSLTWPLVDILKSLFPVH